MVTQWLLFTWEFGCDGWLMYAVLWPDHRAQHPPPIYLPPLFHVSHEKVREYLQSHAISTYSSEIKQLLVGSAGYRVASFSEIHVNGLEFEKTKLLFLLLTQWWNGLVWGVSGVAIERFYFGQKRRDEGISGRKQCSVCVFTFHMSDLWQCPLFAVLCDDLMRVQTDPRFRSWESCSHIRPILFKLFFFHLFIQGK